MQNRSLAWFAGGFACGMAVLLLALWLMPGLPLSRPGPRSAEAVEMPRPVDGVRPAVPPQPRLKATTWPTGKPILADGRPATTQPATPPAEPQRP